MNRAALALVFALVLGHTTHASADDALTYARKNFATMQWYVRHCRDLSRLERAVRKLDDPGAFVCDAEAGKRPAKLTPAYVRRWEALGLDLPDELQTLDEYIASVEAQL